MGRWDSNEDDWRGWKDGKYTPIKLKTILDSDETQFWVCPHCGGDTEYRNGKQFCNSCNTYL